jgi:hypothetical protein
LTTAFEGPLAKQDIKTVFHALQVLSGLHEQLSVHNVRAMIDTVEQGSDDRTLMTAFKSQLGELVKLATEVCR